MSDGSARVTQYIEGISRVERAQGKKKGVMEGVWTVMSAKGTCFSAKVCAADFRGVNNFESRSDWLNGH